MYNYISRGDARETPGAAPLQPGGVPHRVGLHAGRRVKHICVYVCVCIYIYIYIYTSICMYLLCIYTFTCLHVYMYVIMCVCIYIYICI